MDRFKEMSVLRRVIDFGSMTTAAQDLHLSQPAVSRIVADLETRLGVHLLHRGPPLVPTEAGTLFYKRSGDILAALEDMELELRGNRNNVAGVLHIATSATMAERVLLPLLSRLQAVHPDLTIDLQLEDKPLDLVASGLDAAIRLGPIEDERLIARRIGLSRAGLFASASYIQRRGLPRTVEDLAQHDFCLPANDSGTTLTLVGKNGERVNVPLHASLYSNSSGTLRAAALNGLGIAPLPYRVVCDPNRQDSAGDLVHVLSDWSAVPRDLFIVYPETRHLPYRVRAFIDFLVREMKEEVFGEASGDDLAPQFLESA